MDKKTFGVSITKLKSIISQHIALQGKEFGVSSSEALYLKCLALLGKQTQSKLTTVIGFDKARSSRVLSELESRALVQKSLDSSDSRKVYYEITAKGLAIQNAIEKSLDEFIDNVIFNNVELEEKQKFFGTLSKMLKNINDYNKGEE